MYASSVSELHIGTNINIGKNHVFMETQFFLCPYTYECLSIHRKLAGRGYKLVCRALENLQVKISFE